VVERGRKTLEWLSTKFGRYPYPQLSITNFIRGGGMEYPMLVMNGSASQGLILHEVGHIYFYGILANNEQKEAWLDEGFTTFQTSWYMENRYGPLGYDKEKRLKSAPWFLKNCYPLQSSRESNENYILYYMTSGFNEPISRYAYKFKEPMSYRVNAYSKGSVFYRMLRYVVGDEIWESICRTYFDEWKFKHVNEARFKEVCERVSGMDLDWFFNQWLHDTVLIDYALGKVKKEQLADGSYKTTVEVIRKGKGIMPVEVLVETETGEKVIKRWDGKDKKGTIEFVTKARAKKVVVDPNNQILDKNLLNNGPIKFEIYPDFPMINYKPRDAYLLQWRPSLWYNDLDGLKLGLLVKGNYMGRYHNLQLGVWYGPMSKKVDFSVRYYDPVESLGGRTWALLGFQKMEGRLIGDVGLSFTFSKYLSMRPFHYLRLGFNYSELRDLSYAFYRYKVKDLQEWEKGVVNKVYFAYHVNPRGAKWFSDFRLRLQSSQDFLGSDFNFNKISGEVTFRTSPANIDLSLRWFAGSTIKGERPPLQELFCASGANPRAKFEKFWLRSKGAFPKEINYHLGGDGNLRGYYNHFISGKQIVAFNFEYKTKKRLPLISELTKSLKVSTALVGFFDTGKVWDEISGEKYTWNLSDAGFGFRFNKRILGRNHTLRVDFPIWLNRPLAGDKELKFRWVMSFSEAF
ncbi:MAG: M1 family aminopeptidase, partial [bacterium]